METTVEVERLEDGEEILPSYEILRENLKRPARKYATKKPKTYKCTICREIFTRKKDLQTHTSTHDPDKPFECDMCPYRGKNRKYLAKHKVTVHKKSARKLKCPHCPLMFQFNSSLEKHRWTHTGEKPYKCDVCGKAFNTSYSLNTHKFIHTNEKPFKCTYCEYACRDCSTLRKHERRHLGVVGEFPCDQCPNRYNSKARLQTHIKEKHTTVVEVKCEQCGATFKNRTTMRHHVRAVHERLHRCTCGICGRTLTQRGNLHAHMRAHLRLRPALCRQPGCGRTFKDRSALKKHAVIHDTSQHYICDECGRSFSRKYRMERHLRQHLPKVKKVKCQHCGVRFYNNNYLNNHIRTKHGSDRQEFVCDMCGFRTGNKPSIVMHIKHGHASEMDRECKICHRRFKRNVYLKLHYKNSHQVYYKTKPRPKPEVVIKEEPLDLVADLEIDLLDIDKEEPFLGFVNEITNNMLREESASLEESKEEHNTKPEENALEELSNAQENAELNNEGSGSHDENENDKTAETTVDKTITENPTEKQAKPKRKAMQVGEFLQKVIVDAEHEDDEDNIENLEKLAKERIKELLQKSDLNKGIKVKKEYGVRRLKRFTSAEIEEAKRKKFLNSITEERDGDSRTEEAVESDKDGDTSKNDSGGHKLIFNMHQCYVCYKIFQKKPELIDHCKTHFDVCNEHTLKKCPLCPYVTKLTSNLKRHLRVKHGEHIAFSFMQIKDKRDNTTGSRYYYETKGEKFDKLEIIPSVKILNKKASMDLDKRNREIRDKTIAKRKLVRIGKEWVVQHEKLDVNDCMVPKKVDVDGNYLEYLKNLSVQAKNNGVKMLYPCNNCEKVCQNLSALTLHMRKHDPNPKPFKKKVWKHKMGNITGKPDNNTKNPDNNMEDPDDNTENPDDNAVKPNNNVKNPVNNTENRTAKPKPIVSKHRCDPKLKDFYENNIKGGDIEFWQFLKIFNKMDRENVKDFQDLENRTDFGIHFSENNEVLGNQISDDNPQNSRQTNELIEDSDNPKNSRQKLGKVKKIVKRVSLNKTFYKKRLEAKKKLREKIEKETQLNSSQS